MGRGIGLSLCYYLGAQGRVELLSTSKVSHDRYTVRQVRGYGVYKCQFGRLVNLAQGYAKLVGCNGLFETQTRTAFLSSCYIII